MQSSLIFQEISKGFLHKFWKYKEISSKFMTSAILSRPGYTNSLQDFRYLLSIAPKTVVQKRSIKIWPQLLSESAEVVEGENDQEKKRTIDPSKDRTKIISPETSIRYMKSKAYKTTYGDEPVWVKYRRNFKGQFTPRKTRKTCIRGGVITTGSPCPICRDEYLVLHYTNVELLKQFINPYTGEIYDTRKIHICQKRLFQLQIAIQKAKFYGLLTYDVPFREYDYKEYYPEWNS